MSDSIRLVRRRLLEAVAEMAGYMEGENSLAARNVIYHAEELLKNMDAALRGEDPPGADTMPKRFGPESRYYPPPPPPGDHRRAGEQ